jgi:exopolyphosphatase/guanosine-5'-triphosphate,3'-diphosphate pyrophosphatase
MTEILNPTDRNAMSLAGDVVHHSFEPVAVIDVGSNSVRMVVFTGPPRGRLPIFNEKILCGLGASLEETGRLDPKGAERAREALRRFAALGPRMGVAKTHVVATAAVREAEDGAAFVAEIEQEFGLRIRVLSGQEEARFAGFGVLHGNNDRDGLVGDLGGGSLELVVLDDGEVTEWATLPIGTLRLAQSESMEHLRGRIDGAMATVPWLRAMRGRSLYLVGGAWRSLARVHMAHNNYPLKIIDNYEATPSTIRSVSRLLTNQSPESLRHLDGVSPRRAGSLPVGSLVLRRLLALAQPSRVVFSAHGLREGVLYDSLTPTERAGDPLIEACRTMADQESRFAVVGNELFEWMQPIFADDDADEARLRRGACLLSDTGWRVHPDYREYQVFRGILRAPFAGVNHPERAFMAYAVYVRYRGRADGKLHRQAAALIDPAMLKQAERTGLALRLAHTLTGGTPATIAQSRLKIDNDCLTLAVDPQCRPLLGETVSRRLKDLADAFGREPKLT